MDVLWIEAVRVSTHAYVFLGHDRKFLLWGYGDLFHHASVFVIQHVTMHHEATCKIRISRSYFRRCCSIVNSNGVPPNSPGDPIRLNAADLKWIYVDMKNMRLPFALNNPLRDLV